MLYKFKSKAAGDVIMTAPVGDRMMRIIGHEPAAKGILLPEVMPAAIAALEAAIQAEEQERKLAEQEAAAEGRPLPPPPGIQLHQRAWPLIELLKRSQAASHEVVWGV